MFSGLLALSHLHSVFTYNSATPSTALHRIQLPRMPKNGARRASPWGFSRGSGMLESWNLRYCERANESETPSHDRVCRGSRCGPPTLPSRTRYRILQDTGVKAALPREFDAVQRLGRQLASLTRPAIRIQLSYQLVGSSAEKPRRSFRWKQPRSYGVTQTKESKKPGHTSKNLALWT